ncbi:MAG: DedA family protein [Candidatus Aenigmarchaeota archaeon]|nr:DedA family protein [Candidatus Aenigmarchaeota archaeon]
MFESIFSGVEGLVTSMGFVGMFLATFLETIFPPIPSEIVIPLGGYVANVSGLGLPGLALMSVASALGSTVGAVMIYEIARRGGRAVILKWGRRVMVDDKKLKVAEKWFEKHGDHAVFLCRMAPGLREIISIPAGLAKMDRPKFLALTFAGSLVWSAFLASIGFYFADAWKSINLGGVLNMVALVLVMSLASYFVFKHFQKTRKA